MILWTGSFFITSNSDESNFVINNECEFSEAGFTLNANNPRPAGPADVHVITFISNGRDIRNEYAARFSKIFPVSDDLNSRPDCTYKHDALSDQENHFHIFIHIIRV